MRTGIIYKFWCTLTGDFIIGSTINPTQRRNCYFASLQRGTWENKNVQECFNEYKKHCFKWDIIHKDIPESILSHIEDIYIGALCGRLEDKGLGMNVNDASITRHSEETRKKISEKSKLKIMSDEAKDKISKFNKGKILSEETKNKLKDKGGLVVYQYTKQGEFIKEFKSLARAGIEVGVQGTNVSTACTHKSSCMGFIWRRAKDVDFDKSSINKTLNRKKNPGRSKLTIEQVREIRALIKDKKASPLELSKLYKISRNNISVIINNKSWIEE